MTVEKTIDVEAEVFDPKAPCFDSYGREYADFKARLKGEWEDTPCVKDIQELLERGRSQEFCRIFSEGYRLALAQGAIRKFFKGQRLQRHQYCRDWGLRCAKAGVVEPL